MKKIFVLFLVSCLCSISLVAGENPKNEQNACPHHKIFGEPFLNQQIVLGFKAQNQQFSNSGLNSKSPQKGLVFSLAVPGLGEMYSKSKIKGFVFLGFETLAWASYFFHKKKGNDWKEQYCSFVENEWDQNRWQNWWSSLSPEDQDRFPRYELPESENDEYFEMIGKYDKYNAGWKDVDWIPGLYKTDVSKASLYFMDLRKNTNSEYKLAAASTTIIFFNHVLSALDAVWSVKRFNKNFKASSKLDYVFIDDQPTLVAGIGVDW